MSQLAFGGLLAGDELFHERTQDIGNGFVQRPGLAVVLEIRRVLQQPVAQFVGDDAERGGEGIEDLPVPVAHDHLRAVPKRVVVLVAVVHGAAQRHARPVQAGTLELVGKEVMDGAEPVIGPVDVDVVDRGVALGPDQYAGGHLDPLCIADGALQAPGRFDQDCPGGGFRKLPFVAQGLVQQERLPGAGGNPGAGLRSDGVGVLAERRTGNEIPHRCRCFPRAVACGHGRQQVRRNRPVLAVVVRGFLHGCVGHAANSSTAS